jgi:hypothetical protein
MMKTKIINHIAQSILVIIIGAFIGYAHYLNANPSYEKLDVGQVFEQIEAIMVHRKTIQKNWRHCLKQKYCKSNATLTGFINA